MTNYDFIEIHSKVSLPYSKKVNQQIVETFKEVQIKHENFRSYHYQLYNDIKIVFILGHDTS